MDIYSMDERSKVIISDMLDYISEGARKASMNILETNPEEPLTKNIRLMLILFCEVIYELDLYEELKENPITNNSIITLRDFMEHKNE